MGAKAYNLSSLFSYLNLMIKYNPTIKRFFDETTKRFVSKSHALKSSNARKELKKAERVKKKVIKPKKKAIEKFPEYKPTPTTPIPEGYKVLSIDAEGERQILEHETLNFKTKEQSIKDYLTDFMEDWAEDIDFEVEDDY